MWNALLPIGSVVLLKESEKRVMIMGFVQAKPEDTSVVYDYCGCLYPEGYMDANKIFLFNHGQIDRVFSLGYMDEEQFEFSDKIMDILTTIREQEENGESSESENEEDADTTTATTEEDDLV